MTPIGLIYYRFLNFYRYYHYCYHYFCVDYYTVRCAVEVWHQARWWINVWCGIYNNRLTGQVSYEDKLTKSRYLELTKLQYLILYKICRWVTSGIYFSNTPASLHTRSNSIFGIHSSNKSSGTVIPSNGLHIHLNWTHWSFLCGDTSSRDCM